jgi:hypothetical protein
VRVVRYCSKKPHTGRTVTRSSAGSRSTEPPPTPGEDGAYNTKLSGSETSIVVEDVEEEEVRAIEEEEKEQDGAPCFYYEYNIGYTLLITDNLSA